MNAGGLFGAALALASLGAYTLLRLPPAAGSTGREQESQEAEPLRGFQPPAAVAATGAEDASSSPEGRARAQSPLRAWGASAKITAV